MTNPTNPLDRAESHIRHGVTRTVILTRRYAIKIPCPFRWRHFLQGLICNMTERQFWRSADRTYMTPNNDHIDPDNLAPIVLSIPGGWLNVMRRAEPITQEQFESINDSRFRFIPVERKPDSFGTINGRIVAIDYGG